MLNELNSYIRERLEIPENVSIAEYFEQNYDVIQIENKDFYIVEEKPAESDLDQAYMIVRVFYNGELYYIKYKGFYDSWNGVFWDEDVSATLVVPKEVVTIVYEEV